MSSSKQLEAFAAKQAGAGMDDLRYTFAKNGRRTPIQRGNEITVIRLFQESYDAGMSDLLEADHESGYYEATAEMLFCDCGDGLNCEKVKITSYD